MVIFDYNQYMTLPDCDLFSQLTLQLNLDVKIDKLKTPQDVANAMRYTIKGANDLLIKSMANTY